MSYVSHVAGPTRYFDHIYDPVYTVSSQKDVLKATIKAIHKSAPIHVVSIYPTMFSDMSYRPCYECWKRKYPLPYSTNSHEAVIINNNNSGVEKNNQFGIEGTLRCNFFCYPRDCVKTVNLRLNLPTQCPCMETSRAEYQTVGCQTFYRESSAQTRPYLPDYYLAHEKAGTPEILRIVNILPSDLQPGKIEAGIIERIRKRRQYHIKTPQPNTLKEWSEWRTVLEAFEWEQFLDREKSILESQEDRMEFVKEMMANREINLRENSSSKIQSEFLKIDREKKTKLEKLDQKFNREIRKIEFVRKNMPRRYKAENVVKEHVDHTSDLYAPRMRFGIHPKRQHFQPFNSFSNARLESLEMKYIEVKKHKCKVKRFDRLSKPKGPVTEIIKGFSGEWHLNKLYRSMKKLGDSKHANKGRAQYNGRMPNGRNSPLEENFGPSQNTRSNSEIKTPGGNICDRDGFVKNVIKESIALVVEKDSSSNKE